MKRNSLLNQPLAIILVLVFARVGSAEIIRLSATDTGKSAPWTSNTGFTTLRNDLLNPIPLAQNNLWPASTNRAPLPGSLLPLSTDPLAGEGSLLPNGRPRRPSVSLLHSFLNCGVEETSADAAPLAAFPTATFDTDAANPSPADAVAPSPPLTPKAMEALASGETLPIHQHGFLGAPGTSRLVGLRKSGQPVAANRRPIAQGRVVLNTEDESFLGSHPSLAWAATRASGGQPVIRKTFVDAMSTVARVSRAAAWLAGSFGLVTLLAVLLIPSRARTVEAVPAA